MNVTRYASPLLLLLLTAFAFPTLGQASLPTTLSSANFDQVVDVAMDNSQNLYVLAVVDGTPSIDLMPLTPVGEKDLVVAKFASDGSLLWAFVLGTPNDDVGWAIAVDASQTVYVAGSFVGNGDVDPGAGTATVINSFVAMYDGSGNYEGHFPMDRAEIHAMAAHGGNLYLGGKFSGTVDFDPGAGTDERTVAGFSDGFLASYTPTGTLNWVQQNIASTGNDETTDLVLRVDGSGLYTVGSGTNASDIDPGAGTTTAQGLILASYDLSGTFEWGFGVDGEATAVAVDEQNRPYLAGTIAATSSADLDPGPDEFLLSSPTSRSGILAAYDATGGFRWAFVLGSTGLDSANDLLVDLSNRLFVGGTYNRAPDMDPSPARDNLPFADPSGGYLASYTLDGAYRWARGFDGDGFDDVQEIAFAANTVFVAGEFGSTDLDVDPSADTRSFSTAGGDDIFLARYSSDLGQLLDGGGTITPPSTAPTLLSPADGAVDVPTSGTPIAWESLAGSTEYDYAWSTSATLHDDSTFINTTSSTSIQLPLEKDVTYYWRVRARNADGPGPWSPTRSFTTSAGAAGDAPLLSTPEHEATGVQVAGGVLFQWELPAGFESYRLQVSTDAFFDLVALDVDGSGTIYEALGLAENTTYYWRVAALDASFTQGPWSETWQFTTADGSGGGLAAPMLIAPTNGTTALDPAGGILFQWQSVTGAATYGVQVSTDDGFATTAYEEDFLTGTAHEALGLAEGTTYYWRVRARTDGGDLGDWSARWNFTTGGGGSALPAPTLVAPTNQATNVEPGGGVLFQWEPVTGATRYRLEVASNNDFFPLAYAEGNLTGSPHEALGLLEGTTYFWRMRAYSDTDSSAWSATWSFSTSGGGLAAPALLMPARSEQGVALMPRYSWEAVAGAASYRVQIATDDSFATLTHEATTDSTHLTHDGSALMPGTLYFWRVQALDALSNAGPWSAAWAFTTEVPLGLVTLLAPADDAAGVDTTGGIAFLWSSATDAAGYRLYVDTQFPPDAREDGFVGDFTDTTATVRGLLTDTPYFWRVFPLSDGGLTGEPSEVFAFTTAPFVLPAPTPAAPADGATLADNRPLARWTPVDGAERYRVDVAQDADFTDPLFQFAFGAATDSLRLTRLAANTTYFWRVRAETNSGDEGRWSATWRFTTGATTLLPPMPTAPIGGVTGVHPGVQLEWTENQCCPFYEIQVATDDAFSATSLLQEIDTDGTRWTVLLDPNTTYFWRLREVQGQDRSAWSPTESFTTADALAALTPPTPTTPADGATGVSVQNGASFAWEQAAGEPGYHFQLATDAAFTEIVTSRSTSGTQLVAFGLMEATTYHWRVRSSTNDGVSAWSAVQSFTAFAPASITGLSPTSGPVGTEVTITGTSFATPPESNIVRFGAARATVLSGTATSLTVRVPSGATSGRVSLTLGGRTVYSTSRFTLTFDGGGDLSEDTFDADTLTVELPMTGEVALGDFDGDGLADLVLAGTGSELSVLRNLSSPLSIGFGDGVMLTAGGNLTGIAVADFNDDGLLDVAAVSQTTKRVYYYRNTSTVGSLSFVQDGSFGTWNAPLSLAASDLDLDGQTDLMVTSTERFVLIAENTSSPTQITLNGSATMVYDPFVIYDAVADDLDGDGWPDLVALPTGGSVDIRPNTQSGSINDQLFGDAALLPTGGTDALEVATGDLDGDGLPEIVTITLDGRNEVVTVFPNQATAGTLDAASFGPPLTLTAGASLRNLKLADMNGDALLDIVVANGGASGTITVLQNNGGAGKGQAISFKDPVSVPSGGDSPAGLVLGDLDGDGVPEMLAANTGTNTLGVLRNQDATGVAVEPVPDATVPMAFTLGANYPNPFNPQTVIPFTLPEAAHVRLRVFDALGREVAVLVDERLAPNPYQVTFDAGSLPSGLYLYRLEAGRHALTGTMVLVK